MFFVYFLFNTIACQLFVISELFNWSIHRLLYITAHAAQRPTVLILEKLIVFINRIMGYYLANILSKYFF